MNLIGQKVTVLGAGVAGLAVSRALAMRGAQVTVLEQADAVREVGAGLQVSPNGAAVLRALGLADSLLAVSTRAQAVRLCDGFTGDQVMQLDMAGLRPEDGYHFVHRADLISILLEGAREVGVELRLLQKIDSIDLAGDRPSWRSNQGATGDADILIGADGLHSRVRVALNGPSQPIFTRQVAWRALIPESPGAPNVVEVHMGPGRHLVSYPLRGGTLRNLVAVEERGRWVEEGWTLRDDRMDMQLAFESFSPRVRGWLEQVQDVWLWGLFRHPVATHWYKALPWGAAAILGDAVHPTLPFLAQGASMAMEDAWVLADCLAGHETAGAGLAAYQARRAARCTRIVAAADFNARAYHLSGPLRGLAHLALRLGAALAPDAALRRYDWLYGHDVTRA